MAKTSRSADSAQAPADTDSFADALLAWYDSHGRRDLPWRQSPSPYQVWLSEIMLQQTQVATVQPYYRRFLERFPDLASLAAASLEEVLEHWAGLGYYSRARHLHRTAQIIAAEHEGHFPATLEALTGLPGIGRSTAGAILAIAFGQRAAILDGNVKRVLARYGGIAGWPESPAIRRQLWALSENLAPSWRADDYTQAIMDLGATVCTRNTPRCQNCPLMKDCVAQRESRTGELPSKRPAKILPTRECYFLLLRDKQGRVYLERKPAPGLWGGLWCFPEFARWQDLQSACRGPLAQATILETKPARRHTFSHYHLNYTPVYAQCQKTAERIADGENSRWVDPALDPPPLPTPIQRLYQALHSNP